MKKLNKQYLKEIYPYWIVIFLTFYLLPLLMQDTGSAMFIFLVLMPAICFLLGLIHGSLKGFDILFILAVFVFFVPTIYYIYGAPETAIYCFINTGIALVGELIGWLINFIVRRKKS